MNKYPDIYPVFLSEVISIKIAMKYGVVSILGFLDVDIEPDISQNSMALVEKGCQDYFLLPEVYSATV